MKKLITFDCYGTLIDTRPIDQEVAKIGSEHHLDGDKVSAIYTLNDARLMYAEPYISLDELIRTALERCDIMLGTDFMKNEYERMLHVYKSLQPFPEVIDVLKELRQRDYQLVIMSNSCMSIMEHNLKALDNQINEVILAEDVHAYKPQLTFFKQAEEQLDVKNREHCHVAQGYFEDIIPCTLLDWKKVWVNRENEKGIAAQQPYKEVQTLDQILPLFN